MPDSEAESEMDLTDVLVTERLWERPSRLPDYEAENRAMAALVQDLATAPEELLQRLCRMALDLCRAYSAGVILEEETEGGRIFRLHAVAGEMASSLPEITPRDFSPDGVVLDRDAPQLFVHPERCYPSLKEFPSPISEMLLVPIRVEERPIGTVWLVHSDTEHPFDPEDVRLLTNLSRFAAAAHQAVQGRKALQTTNERLGVEVALHQAAREAGEKEKARQTRLFDTVLASIVDFAFSFDRQGRFTYLNQALLDLLRKTEEEAVGKTFLELGYAPDLAAQLNEQIETVFRTGQPLRDQVPYTDVTGRVGYYEHIFVPVYGMDGQVELVAGSSRDISERYGMEAQLREAKSRLEATLNAVEIGTWTWDIPANRVVADKNLRRFFSVAEEDAQGGPIAHYIAAMHPDDRAPVEATIQRALQNRKSYEAEYRLVDAEGGIIHVIARGLPEFDAEGSPIALHGVVLDITELKAREQEIHSLNRRLTRSMRETHHRVKNNLQVVAAMIDMQTLEHQEGETVPIAELTRLKTHIHTLAIVHELLTLSIREEEAVQRISARAVLETLLPLLQRTAWKQSVQYEIAEVVLTSKQCIALSLVLNELVSNGLKHGQTAVHVSLTVEERNVVLVVTDDGNGFSLDFDPRMAANTGLELVSSLVQTDLQGNIAYSNKPAGGGSVSVVFPLPADED